MANPVWILHYFRWFFLCIIYSAGGREYRTLYTVHGVHELGPMRPVNRQANAQWQARAGVTPYQGAPDSCNPIIGAAYARTDNALRSRSSIKKSQTRILFAQSALHLLHPLLAGAFYSHDIPLYEWNSSSGVARNPAGGGGGALPTVCANITFRSFGVLPKTL